MEMLQPRFFGALMGRAVDKERRDQQVESAIF
jgi:hypothetical protein